MSETSIGHRVYLIHVSVLALSNKLGCLTCCTLVLILPPFYSLPIKDVKERKKRSASRFFRACGSYGALHGEGILFFDLQPDS